MDKRRGLVNAGLELRIDYIKALRVLPKQTISIDEILGVLFRLAPLNAEIPTGADDSTCYSALEYLYY